MLMHQGYAQAEGVNNLGGVPSTGCLVSFRLAGFKGAWVATPYIAICRPRRERA